MDAFLISAGIGSWFGFTAPLFIWVFARGVHTLAPLSKVNRKIAVAAAILRIAIGAFILFGILGFAAFYGQLTPSKDIAAAFLFGGAAVFYLSLYCYRRFEKRLAAGT